MEEFEGSWVQEDFSTSNTEEELSIELTTQSTNIPGNTEGKPYFEAEKDKEDSRTTGQGGRSWGENPL